MKKQNVLIDHILSETICLFCFCVLFSTIYPKIKLKKKKKKKKKKTGITYTISIVKWYFGIFILTNVFSVFFGNLQSFMVHDNIVKPSEFWKKKKKKKKKNASSWPTLPMSA